MGFSTDYGKERRRLRGIYFNEPPAEILPGAEADAAPWYGSDVQLLFSDAQRAGFVCQQVGVPEERDAYWCPSKNMAAHMREMAVRQQGSLVKPTAHNRKETNPEFARFPVGYDPCLAGYEIDDTIRIESMRDGRLDIRRANYLDQLTTNIHCDVKPGGWKIHLRDASVAGGRLKAFSPSSPLANTIGACTVIIDRAGVPLLRYRGRPEELDALPSDAGKRMAVMAKGWHCAASGVTKWQDLPWGEPASGLRSFDWLLRGVRDGMLREIEEETGLTPEDGLDIAPLAFARELKRAGKPNFFFITRVRELTAAQVVRLVKQRHPRDAGEYRAPPRKGITVVWNHLLGRDVSFRIGTEFRLDRLARHGFKGQATLGFTYENYMALTLAARWWRDTASP